AHRSARDIDQSAPAVRDVTRVAASGAHAICSSSSGSASQLQAGCWTETACSSTELDHHRPGRRHESAGYGHGSVRALRQLLAGVSYDSWTVAVAASRDSRYSSRSSQAAGNTKRAFPISLHALSGPGVFDRMSDGSDRSLRAWSDRHRSQVVHRLRRLRFAMSLQCNLPDLAQNKPRGSNGGLQRKTARLSKDSTRAVAARGRCN